MNQKIKQYIKHFIEKRGYRLLSEQQWNAVTQQVKKNEKYETELDFWRGQLLAYQQWYNGEIKELYSEPSPSDDDKIKYALDLKDNALLTWHRIHQERKYAADLQLPTNIFANKKLLDIGSGPIPSATVFTDADLYCLDPLMGDYLKAGFPFFYFDKVKFVCSPAEKMPFPDKYFDAVISVNAIDHVDDFEQTANEISRVLKPDGQIRLHIHYHLRTAAEPIELNDHRVATAFAWCKGLKKIHQTNQKHGYTLTDDTESYTVWSNF